MTSPSQEGNLAWGIFLASVSEDIRCNVIRRRINSQDYLEFHVDYSPK